MVFDRNAWLREDTLRRKQRAIIYLGGKCVDCCTEENLQFDHEDPSIRSFDITRNLNRRWEVLVVELDKCVLRCKPCHITKTKSLGEYGGGLNKIQTLVHGTAHAYTIFKCRCDNCKYAKSLQRQGLIRNSQIVQAPKRSLEYRFESC